MSITSVYCRIVALLITGLLFFMSCASPPKATKAEPTTLPQPRLVASFKVACFNLAGYGKRIEKKDIERFAGILKREQIEILAVQGITRYPNVKTRVDFVTELAVQADLRQAFGESTDIMGRQTGNAVFSVYPIRSTQKKEFDVPSAFSEYALQVAIDAGLLDVAIVSTWLPPNAPVDDITKCVRSITGLQATPKTPFIVSGNLPVLKKTTGADLYTDIQSALPEGSAKQTNSRLWYIKRELFRLVQAGIVNTDLGTLTVADFGLYQQAQQ